MKKKVVFLSILFFLSFLGVNAQMSYYHRGEKMPLTVDRNFVHIVADEDFLRSSGSSRLFQNYHLEWDDSEPLQGMMKLRLNSATEMSDYSAIVEFLKQNEQVRNVFPFFERKGAEPIGTSDIFYIHLKNVGDSTLLRKTAERLNVQVVRQVPYMSLWYILSLKNSAFNNSIEATNYFFETGLFEDVDPAFMFNFRPNCTNDPMFDRLWGLKETTPRLFVNYGINVCNAWTITRGAGINVAVIDTGIDPDHDDLKANFHPLSFDAQSGTSPSVYLPWFDHGTPVAGVIAAVKNNNLQVVGVAPEAKIMKVSHDLIPFDNNSISAELASGISWAWQNGADIINNSWGDRGDSIAYRAFRSTILESAIDNALTYGRNGKGAVVVFATGNENNSGRINYPSNSHDGILAVGAIEISGQRSTQSNYGEQLDIVAPGETILSTNNNNDVNYNYGTSFAAPHVSGIAALILSVNPNLTGQEVRSIIKRTAQKIRTDLYTYSITENRPHGKWHREMGYGLIDAYAAVRAALETLPFTEITGSQHITPSGAFSINTGQSATWSVSDEFVLDVSPCGTSVTVKPKYFDDASGTLTAVVDEVTLTKDIQHVFIVGTGKVDRPVTFRLNTNQIATWSVTPEFRITTNNVGASVNVAPENASSFSGVVTATLADGTIIEKSINRNGAGIKVQLILHWDRELIRPNVGAFFRGMSTSPGEMSSWMFSSRFNDFELYQRFFEIESSTYFTEHHVALYGNYPLVQYHVTVEILCHYNDEPVHVQYKSGYTSVTIAGCNPIELFDDGWREPYNVNNRYVMRVTLHIGAIEHSPRALEMQNEAFKVFIFPNPASGILNVEIDTENSDLTYDVRLYDNQGNLLRRSTTTDGYVQFNVVNLPNGSYFLHVFDGESATPIKRQVMIER